MANPLRGEAELVAGELGRFVLVFITSALAELQAAWGIATGPSGDLAFLDRLFTLPAALHHDARLALFYALQARHADQVKTLADAGSIIDAAGLPAVRQALARGLVLGFPEAMKDTSEKGDSPPKAESPGAGPH